jgi:hypothetical protein
MTCEMDVRLFFGMTVFCQFFQQLLRYRKTITILVFEKLFKSNISNPGTGRENQLKQRKAVKDREKIR